MILVLISGACSFKQETKSSLNTLSFSSGLDSINEIEWKSLDVSFESTDVDVISVSYTHLRAHETEADLVCRLLLEKKK